MAVETLFALFAVAVVVWLVDQAVPRAARVRAAIRVAAILVIAWLVLRLVATMLPAFP